MPLETAIETIKEKVAARAEQVDINEMVDRIAADTLKDVRRITLALIGIDATWRTPRISSDGMIADLIKDQVSDMVRDRLVPKILARTEKQLTLKGTTALIDAHLDVAIARHIEDAFSTYRDTRITRAIDSFIETRALALINPENP